MRKTGFILGFLVVTPAGRLILASAVITFLISVVFREEVVLYLKWSTVPLGMWLFWLLTILLINPVHLKTHYKPLLITLPIVFVLVILMGTVDASYLRLGEKGEYIGGEVGNFIAVYPLLIAEGTNAFEINRAVRTGVLVLISGLIAYPRTFAVLYKYNALLLTSVLFLLRSIWATLRGILTGKAVAHAEREASNVEGVRKELLAAYYGGRARTEYDFASAQNVSEPPPGEPAVLEENNVNVGGTTPWNQGDEPLSETFLHPPVRDNSAAPAFETTTDNATEHVGGMAPSHVRTPFSSEPSVGYSPVADPERQTPSTPANFNTSTVAAQSAEPDRGSEPVSTPPPVHHEKYPFGSVEPVGITEAELQGTKSWWKPPGEDAPNPTVNSHQPQVDTQTVPFTHSATATHAQEQDLYAAQNKSSEAEAQLRQPSQEEEAQQSFSTRMKSFKDTTVGAISNKFQPKDESTTSPPGNKVEDFEGQEQNIQGESVYWRLPDQRIFNPPVAGGVDEGDLMHTIKQIESCFFEHGVEVKVDNVFPGPTVTKYGLTPGWRKNTRAGGRVRVDDILGREKDLMLALAQPLLRFENVVPGEPMVGLEIPNPSPLQVNMRSVVDTDEWKDFVKTAKLPIPLGIGSQGAPEFADLSKMPHMLVAGATGSGKSVCINSIISGLIFTLTPEQVRFVLIDPKLVELTAYADIPHLYTEVITEVPQVISVLRSLIAEMEGRLYTLRGARARNIIGYNLKSDVKMPYIVLIVDELSDLMITARAEIEPLLTRLSQLARATGIHVVLATQRPSVNVVTGEIKVNFPTRVCFSVQSQPDSRTILDMSGGEKLLGNGDMLYSHEGSSKPKRIQGTFVSEDEIENLVDFWHSFPSAHLPQLDIETYSSRTETDKHNSDGEEDGLFEAACRMAEGKRTVSVSSFQTHLSIGFPRACRLMQRLEDAGIVGPSENGKPRKVIGA